MGYLVPDPPPEGGILLGLFYGQPVMRPDRIAVMVSTGEGVRKKIDEVALDRPFYKNCCNCGAPRKVALCSYCWTETS